MQPDEVTAITRQEDEMDDDLLKRLREAGSTGLDLSPGDPLVAEAAEEIAHLRTALARAAKVLRDWQVSLGFGPHYNHAEIVKATDEVRNDATVKAATEWYRTRVP